MTVKVYLCFYQNNFSWFQTRLRSLGVVDGEAPQTLKDKQAGDYQSLKARITELEGQVWRANDLKSNFEVFLYILLLHCSVFYNEAQDPAVGARPNPNDVREHPAATRTRCGVHGERTQVKK